MQKSARLLINFSLIADCLMGLINLTHKRKAQM
jgi:hypothetical protein